jgi:hypothetical protein
MNSDTLSFCTIHCQKGIVYLFERHLVNILGIISRISSRHLVLMSLVGIYIGICAKYSFSEVDEI